MFNCSKCNPEVEQESFLEIDEIWKCIRIVLGWCDRSQSVRDLSATSDVELLYWDTYLLSPNM